MNDDIIENKIFLSSILDSENYVLPALPSDLDKNLLISINSKGEIVCNLSTSDETKERIAKIASAVFSDCIRYNVIDPEDIDDLLRRNEDDTFSIITSVEAEEIMNEFYDNREKEDWKPAAGWLAAYIYSRFEDDLITELFF